MRRVGSYRDAIEWIALNDDTEWLADGDDVSPSVTLCLVADVFGRSVEEATADLRRAIARDEKASDNLARAEQAKRDFAASCKETAEANRAKAGGA